MVGCLGFVAVGPAGVPQLQAPPGSPSKGEICFCGGICLNWTPLVHKVLSVFIEMLLQMLFLFDFFPTSICFKKNYPSLSCSFYVRFQTDFLCILFLYFHSISFIGNQNDPNQTKASQQTKQQQQLRKLQQKHQQQHQQQQNQKKRHTVNSKTDITKVTPGKKKILCEK